MYDPNIVILAGGISTRMKKSATSAVALEHSLAQDATQKPKSMIGVGLGHRPFLDYLLYNVQKSGYRDVVLLIGRDDLEMQDYYEANNGPGILSHLTIRYVVQPIPEGRAKPLGTVDALKRSLDARPDWKSKQLTVCNSDNLYTIETLRLMLGTSDRNALINYDIQALRFPRQKILQFAILKTDPEGYLQDILEKPSEDQLKEVGDNAGISMNLFRFTYDDIVQHLDAVPLHPVRNEKELPEAVRMMVRAHPRWVKTYRRAEYVPDLTTADDIPQVQQFIREGFSNVKF